MPQRIVRATENRLGYTHLTVANSPDADMCKIKSGLSRILGPALNRKFALDRHSTTCEQVTQIRGT
jgi:hypothetical protein